MKQIISFLLISLTILVGCDKSATTINGDEPEYSSLKSSITDEELDSLIMVNDNYQNLLNELENMTELVIGSDLTWGELMFLSENEELDSIYIRLGLTHTEICHFDTIFNHYSEVLIDEFQLDTINDYDCNSCGLPIEDQFDFTKNYWDYFKEDTGRIDSYFETLSSPGGGDCNVIGYSICCTACVLTMGEIPPLCILCIWQCGCQFCPHEYLHCEWGILNTN